MLLMSCCNDGNVRDETERKLGWADGYVAARRGERDPNRRGKDGAEERVHEGDNWKYGYKAGYKRGKEDEESGVDLQHSLRIERTEGDWGVPSDAACS